MGRRVFRVSGIVLFVLAVLTGSHASVGASPLEVTNSGPDGLRLGLRALVADWRAVAEGTAVPRHDLHLPGFETGGSIGGPRIPVSSAWILVPPGTRPELVVHGETWQGGGDRRLSLSTVPASRQGPAGARRVELQLAPGEPVPAGYVLSPGIAAERALAGRPRSGAAVELGEVSWWRGRRVVPLRIVPVRHDADGLVQGVLEAGDWEIRFVPDTGTAAPPGDVRRRGTGNDSRFAGIFLNPDLLSRVPSEAAHHGLSPTRASAADKALNGKAKSLPATEVRVGVNSTGLIRVLAARLREQNLLDDTPVPVEHLRLYQRRYLPRLDDGSGDPPYVEIEVPIHLVGDGGDFDGSDFFAFHGLRMRDDGAFTADLGSGPETVPACDDTREWNNASNVYWLAVADPGAGPGWARMGHMTDMPAATGPAAANYRRTEYHEEQRAFRGRPQKTSDRTYYNRQSADTLSVNMSPQWSPDPAGGLAEFVVTAASYSPRNSTNWRIIDMTIVRDQTERSVLGQLYVSNVNDLEFGFPNIQPADLMGGKAKLVFTRNGSPFYAYIDAVEVNYDALYRAVNNKLDFHGGLQAGPRPLAVTGFTDDDILLVEVTDPRNPVVVDLATANILPDGDTWTLSIMPDQNSASDPRRFLAFGDGSRRGVPEFEYGAAEAVPDPVSPVAVTESPDLLVVTHPDFTGALDRWVQHRIDRSGGNLKVHVVQTTDLFDWYGGGLRSPDAVRRLVEHARDNWNTWSLVIVGDANENARELGVRPEAKDWSQDFVPSHYHVQEEAVTWVWELMATDKWYVTPDSQLGDFPDNVRGPWEMYTGRLPVNSVEELNHVIDKVIVVESTAEDQDWRKRGIFLADDYWSDGYGAEASSDLVYNSSDVAFLRAERDSVAVRWAGGAPVALNADLRPLSSYLEPPYGVFSPDPAVDRDPAQVRLAVVRDGAAAELQAALSQGGLVAHYQGHANIKVLSSEYWLRDDFTRRDIAAINNAEPWVFFGMGCHVADWAQDTVTSDTGVNESSICEKFLVRSASGSVASYGSSGYEYINPIEYYSGVMMRRWMMQPPTSGATGATLRSRWMLGELMWAAESDMLSSHWNNRYYREMCAQFVVLGDPLMMLDAGPPQVTAVLQGAGGGELSGVEELEALDTGNERTVEIAALDEAGIDRLRVMDSVGEDLTSTVVVMGDSLPPGRDVQQEVHYRLQVPIRPFAHFIDVEVWDTGAPLPADRHYLLSLDIWQNADLFVAGAPVDTSFVFEPDVPEDFTMDVSSAAFLHEGMETTVESADQDNLVLTNDQITYVDDQHLEVTFTATAPAGTAGERAVVLSIDGYETTHVLQAADVNLPQVSIEAVFNFPNPMGDRTRFVFKTGAGTCRGVVRVFATSGHTIAHIGVEHDGGGSGWAEWFGRDDEGDEVANGTYLYRVELEAPGGQIVSQVQRLVVMR